MGKATVYCIMHTERCVAQVSTAGECKIYFEDFMPYGLVLKESNDFDTRINNVISFHSWCASRLIPRDRTYAKEILNSIGASQSVTDRKRAQIALSYYCLSLLDVFWVKEENETVRFEDINLYTLSLSNALVDIALRGCAKRKASIFIKLADKMQSSVRCWQVKSADALTVIRFCMSRGCLRMSRFPSAKL